jgi:hypothetical protein
MVAPMSLVVTANVAPLPADLLQLKSVYFDGHKPLDIVPLDRDQRLSSYVYYNVGVPQYAAQDGDTLTFWPPAGPLTPVLGSYYAKPADLVDGLHATFQRYPQLFVYACLYEAALFYGMMAKMQIWEARYRQLAEGANTSERLRVYGGGRLRIRNS